MTEYDSSESSLDDSRGNVDRSNFVTDEVNGRIMGEKICCIKILKESKSDFRSTYTVINTVKYTAKNRNGSME